MFSLKASYETKCSYPVTETHLNAIIQAYNNVINFIQASEKSLIKTEEKKLRAVKPSIHSEKAIIK